MEYAAAARRLEVTRARLAQIADIVLLPLREQ